jgi:hypothetical protein
MMCNFDAEMNEWMKAWRKKHINDKRHGRQNGKERAWILPKENWEQGLWEDIRTGSPNPLPAYLDENRVHKHEGSHNLKSSWILCANLFFPFRQDLSLLEKFLRAKVSPNIKSLDEIELEYAGEGPLAPSALLGEPHGQRGKNQTSPDVAFKVTLKDGGKGIILTENKFTEHSFYGCSGRKKDHDNPDSKRCLDFINVSRHKKSVCWQLNWKAEGRENRKYWEYLKISDYGQSVLKRCPAATAGYQLFRQQALAEGFFKKGDYKYVASAVAYDARNTNLIGSLRTTGVKDFSKDWGRIFEGRAEFKTFTYQEWLGWVKAKGGSQWKDWIQYIEKRYGIIGGDYNG